MDDLGDGQEQGRIRARVHKLNDMVIGHEGRLAEYGVLLEGLRADLNAVRSTTVTREHLDTKLDGMHRENTLKLENASDKLDAVRDVVAKLQGGIYWAIALIVGGVLLALLNLVLGKTPIGH